MYSRVVRHYGLQSRVPDEKEIINPTWFLDAPVSCGGIQETDNQTHVRVLYIAEFTGSLFFGGLARYVCDHVAQWNHRISVESSQAKARERLSKPGEKNT